jgi:hypothetical protein
MGHAWCSLINVVESIKDGKIELGSKSMFSAPNKSISVAMSGLGFCLDLLYCIL